MPLPSASVVIPSYNHALYIEEALASVLVPELPELDVVLVDDGSSDDTLERLERFAGDARLRVFSQENQGAHAALNRCLAASRGDVVFILNSDDAFVPGRIERFLERFAEGDGLKLLASWIEVVDTGGRSLGVKEGFRNMPPWVRRRGGPGLSDTGELVPALLEANYVATTSNVAFRRELFTEEGLSFLPLRYAHDWDFLLGACRHGGFDLVEEPLVRYRIHPENTIREGREEREGRGLMRFEILWVMARHAGLLDAYTGLGDVRERFWNSLPPFVSETILAQLLFLRGAGPAAPAAYDDLLRPEHPFRRAAIRTLSEEAA